MQNLYDEFKNQNINVIIGSSMGGFAAYHLANSLGICTLLYNPALPYRTSIIQIFLPFCPKNNLP
ncbi:YqiA/YcfP family alpha/beta fold hydrolase [Flavobacterium sp. DSR2-3-3]|uniref:YqiA/YcfP family alpha/beta fold hydrolase n=1 Tax=Flavobacterium sp. DSR2-3-3 TaxID=2804632 RepID=UPI003CEB31DC